jgi:undecaprenyl phosphate-alpha-L-ara4FN deformylase
MNNVVGLKVDVDTLRGMREGVPKLLDLFAGLHVRATLFVPMGKDHTGWTAKRVFTRPGFVSKAQRVGVLETYGLKTLMYGLLLPGPEIARRNGPLMARIMEEGHELGVHGLDHVWWHDHIKHLDRETTEQILRKATDTYREITGTAPLSFAAPGWMINGHALAFFQREGFLYTSDVRGSSPFLPMMAGQTYRVLQVPTTLPTLDEVVGLEGTTQDELADYFIKSLTEDLNILTVHAELEGNRWTGFLEAFIQRALALGFRFERLIDVARRLEPGKLPTCELVYGQVRGRAGEVTLQGPVLKPTKPY